MNLAQTISVYLSTICSAKGKKKSKKKKKKDATDISAEDYYGPNTGGMGPSKALGDPE